MKKGTESQINIAELVEKSRIRITDEFSEPPVILMIQDSIFATLGNFSASTGKAKARKTFNLVAMVAAALSMEERLNYKFFLPEGKNKVLYIDTEQSKYHCRRTLDRIIRLANYPDNLHPDKLEFLSLRPYNPKERIRIIEYAIYNTPDLGFVIIDGVRDMAYDINSTNEATEVITALMKWTDELNIHIHTVLHQNKADDNSRGHLGTELNNKAESVITVAKDEIEPNYSIVKSAMLRDKDFEPFVFSIDESGLPSIDEGFQISQKTESKALSPDEVADSTHFDVLGNIFLDQSILKYKETWKGIKEAYSHYMHVPLGENKAKEWLTYFQRKGIILKNGQGYFLGEKNT